MLRGPWQRHAPRPRALAWLALLLVFPAASARGQAPADASFLAPIALLEVEAVTTPEAPPDSLAAFPAPRVRAWQVGLLRPDRLQHAGLSFTLGAGLTLAFRDRAAAAGVTLALGAGKEWWDARAARSGGGADAIDLVADAVGLGLALVAIRGRAP